MKTFWWWLKSTWWQASYWIRPYDMIADRRRWRWQPAAPCALPPLREGLRMPGTPTRVDRMDRLYGPRCVCDRPPVTITYDANSYRSWCGRCNGRRWG